MRDSHQEWLDMYNTQINSGISVEEWCLQNNIKYKTFLSRLGTLRKLGLLPYAGTVANELNNSSSAEDSSSSAEDSSSSAEDSSSFVEIKPTAKVVNTLANATSIACNIALPNGTSVSITNEISPTLFAAILENVIKC